MAKGKTFIDLELDWLEQKVKEWMDLIDSYSPFSDIEDRVHTEVNAKGIPIIRVIAKKEDTIKTIGNILKDLPTMMAALDTLRERRETSSMETRGGSTIPGLMQNKMANKNQ